MPHLPEHIPTEHVLWCVAFGDDVYQFATRAEALAFRTVHIGGVLYADRAEVTL